MNKSISRFHFPLLNADVVHLNKSWNYQNIISPFYRLYYIEDGAGTLCNSTQREFLERGHLYLIPSFTICNYSCETHLHQYYLHFTEESTDGTSLFLRNRRVFKVPAQPADAENLRRLLTLNPGRGLTKSNNPKVYEKRPIMESFQELNKLLSVSAYMETQGIILQLLSRFLDSGQFQFENQKLIPSRISNTIHFIQTNLHQKITIAELAAMNNLSPDHFSRVFIQHIGERPLPFIQARRVERAQFLLATTEFSLAEIAEQAGFDSISYFSRVFKTITKQTATKYRRNSRAM